MSYLQKYVREVKSRNESYTPPVEKIQSYLAEAKSSASTLFEGVIADCANLSGKSQKDFKEGILKQIT